MIKKLILAAALAIAASAPAWPQAGQMQPHSVKCNSTGSSAVAQDCTNPVILGLQVAPTANTLNQAVTTSQSVSGTTSATCVSGSFQVACVNLLSITADNANAASPSNSLDGWQFNDTIGGSTLQGARQSLDVIANFTAPSSSSNTNRNYVAGVFETNATSGDGGTNTGAGAKGVMFGANAVVRATSGATNLLGTTGMEIDVVNQGTTQSRYGLNLVSWPSAQAAILTEDAALNIYGVAGTGAVAWHNGLLFSNTGGFAPVDTTGCLICTDGTANTVGKGIDISAYSFTTAAFKSPNFQVDGSGNLQAAVVQANANASQAWNFDASAGSVTIANASNQALPVGSGFIFVHDLNDGSAAEYICASGNCALGNSVGGVWVATTTTPAAGKMSIAYNGTVYAIYNNAGGSRAVTGAFVRTRTIP